mmetsp:Transcript_12820/g.36261  ORF Transcript_12820/g.36261 Transcript_12820/m.36261 type:complete len:208 (-) Transcript_12820:940-1563(-)
MISCMTNGRVNAGMTTPRLCIICSLYGVDRTIAPHFRSCMLSPAREAAHAMTDPTRMADTGPLGESLPSIRRNTKEVESTVASVTPDTGLFEDPTRPAIKAPVAPNTRPNSMERTTAVAASPSESRRYSNIKSSGIGTTRAKAMTERSGASWRSRSGWRRWRREYHGTASRSLPSPDVTLCAMPWTSFWERARTDRIPPTSMAPTPT